MDSNFDIKKVTSHNKEALLHEYKRKLLLYKILDKNMNEKYKMDFNNFEKDNVVSRSDFSWDVESDSMEWEHAIEGIKTMKEKITVLASE